MYCFKQILTIPLIIFFVLFATINRAENSTKDPVALLSSISDKITTELKASGEKAGNEEIEQIIEENLREHIDVNYMSQLVLGRDAWFNATLSEKEEFKNVFVDLIISSFAKTVKSYANQKIEFDPLRESIEGKNYIEVTGKIMGIKNKPISLSYDLKLVNNNWKIYDMNIEGISVISSYHSQIYSILKKEKTVSALNDYLRKL